MNALFVLIFTCGGALAIGRGLDLALWTDWNTGLCTAGSVWLRYGGLWAALVVGIIAARKLARQPLVLRSACKPARPEHDPGGAWHGGVLLGGAEPLYGEQLQLAPGGADCHGLADAGCVGVSFGDGPRPLAAGNVQWLPAVRGRDLHVPALLLLGTAPGAGAAVPRHHGSRSARGAVWLWHVLHRRAGAFHCGAGGRK